MVTQASSRGWFLYTPYHRAETYEKHVSYDHRNGDYGLKYYINLRNLRTKTVLLHRS